MLFLYAAQVYEDVYVDCPGLSSSPYNLHV